jgi:hypothetical protein
MHAPEIWLSMHASNVQYCRCSFHAESYHRCLHHCAFSFYIEELLPLPSFYIEGSNLRWGHTKDVFICHKICWLAGMDIACLVAIPGGTIERTSLHVENLLVSKDLLRPEGRNKARAIQWRRLLGPVWFTDDFWILRGKKSNKFRWITCLYVKTHQN